MHVKATAFESPESLAAIQASGAESKTQLPEAFPLLTAQTSRGHCCAAESWQEAEVRGKQMYSCQCLIAQHVLMLIDDYFIFAHVLSTMVQG